MGHLLSTVNPDAAAEIGRESMVAVAAPPVGATVAFYPRTGEYRAGKNEFAAIVTGSHTDGTCDLVIFYDADDCIGQRNIPRRQNGEGLGWAPVGWSVPTPEPLMTYAGILTEESLKVAMMRPGSIVHTTPEPPTASTGDIEILASEVFDLAKAVTELTERVQALEAKRGPGRPKKEAT